VIAATNVLHAVDPSFLIPGRLDRVIYMGLPSEVGSSADRTELRCGFVIVMLPSPTGGKISDPGGNPSPHALVRRRMLQVGTLS
jgi:hypothetical protein